MDYVGKTVKAYTEIFDSYVSKRTGSSKDSYHLFKKFIQLVPGKNILEIGFGLGFDAENFIKNGFSYTGVDPVEKFCTLVSKKLPQSKIVCEDIRHSNFPSLTFDGIFALASLLHFNDSDVQQILSNCHTWLKPNGILLVSVKGGEGEETRGEGRYFNFFTKDKLLKLTQKKFTLVDYSTNSPKEYNTGKETWLNFYLKKS